LVLKESIELSKLRDEYLLFSYKSLPSLNKTCTYPIDAADYEGVEGFDPPDKGDILAMKWGEV